MIRALTVLAVLAACGPDAPPAEPSEIDQCIRRDIFFACLAALPKGPERVSDSNDWDEVVSECESSAHYMAIRKLSQIKLECRP